MKEAHSNGAVLFRGFPVETITDFDLVVRAFALEPFSYASSFSNAVRIEKTDLVFTANEAPPEIEIFFHHEMAQTPVYPRWLFFYCDHAPESGGATPICRSDILFQQLELKCPNFIEKCTKLGLKYSNVMPEEKDFDSGMGRSWKDTLGVPGMAEAEEKLKLLGYTWEWQLNHALRVTTPTLPAVKCLSNGRISFFNQLIAVIRGWKDSRNDPSSAIQFGDGTPLKVESIQTAINLADALAFDIPWEAGDFALLDNTVVMHGRRPFTGKRAVLASMAVPGGNSFE